MKHQGCILEFTEQRNNELLRAYRKALSGKSFIDIGEISEIIVNSPCSRFWVSEERAMMVISAINRDIPILDTMRPLKREMFEELHTRVMEMKRKSPKMSMPEIVMAVVNSPAPKFYMRPRCAMEIIYKIKNGYYENIKRFK